MTSRCYVICVSPAPWNADLVAMLGAPGLMSSLGLRVCRYLRVPGAVEAAWLAGLEFVCRGLGHRLGSVQVASDMFFWVLRGS